MPSNIEFKENIFVYSLDYHEYAPSSLRVSVPEVFLLDKNTSPKELKISKGSNSIFINATPPALSQYVTTYNYITIPIVGNIGNHINVGERFICHFINSNPAYGYIIARC